MSIPFARTILGVSGAALVTLSAPAIGQGGAAAATTSPAAAYELGRCLVQRDRASAAALVARLPLAGAMGGEAMAAINASGCRAQGIDPSGALLLRAGIAQALYLADFPRYGEPPADNGRLVNLNLPVEAAAGQSSDPNAATYEWADCVARNDLETMAALIDSPAGSQREQNVLARLAPTMSSCLAAQQQLSLGRAAVRGVLVQATYHAFYRYWNNELRPANSEGGERQVCRTLEVAGSLTRSRTLCLTQRQWDRQRVESRRLANRFGHEGPQ